VNIVLSRNDEVSNRLVVSSVVLVGGWQVYHINRHGHRHGYGHRCCCVSY
jgi:hypothetical protein